LLAYPSLDEGFGLPILEAFYMVYQSSVVICPSSKKWLATLPTCESRSVEDIRAGLEFLLNEDQAASSIRLKKMIIRLHLFNWAKTARSTLKVYQTAIDQRRS
jgi:glycosyltransferase involved in cell wall biosynthesis